MDKIHRLVADAGYESEENYTYFEGLEHTDAYIKPANHEQKKKKKYRTDPGRRENMAYHADEDAYICTQGKKAEGKDGLSERNFHLSLFRLPGLPLQRQMYPQRFQQETHGRKNQVPLCQQEFPASERRDGTAHLL